MSAAIGIALHRAGQMERAEGDLCPAIDAYWLLIDDNDIWKANY